MVNDYFAILHHQDLCCFFMYFSKHRTSKPKGMEVYITWKFSSLQMGALQYLGMLWESLKHASWVIQLEYSWYSVLWIYITCLGYMYVRYTSLHWLIFHGNCRYIFYVWILYSCMIVGNLQGSTDILKKKNKTFVSLQKLHSCSGFAIYPSVN